MDKQLEEWVNDLQRRENQSKEEKLIELVAEAELLFSKALDGYIILKEAKEWKRKKYQILNN